MKKGEKVALRAIFENDTAAISTNSFTDRFLGYGFEGQLPIDLAKLEECIDATKELVDDSSRNNTKPKENAGESNAVSNGQNTLTK